MITVYTVAVFTGNVVFLRLLAAVFIATVAPSYIIDSD